jgi:hypothetical protein
MESRVNGNGNGNGSRHGTGTGARNGETNGSATRSRNGTGNGSRHVETNGNGSSSRNGAATRRQRADLEPMFTLAVAAERIPFPSVPALRTWLWRHRQDFPGRYRQSGHTNMRLLTLGELAEIRRRTIRQTLSRKIDPSR